MIAIKKAIPLTKTQEGIYIDAKNSPSATLYNIPFCTELDPAIDVARFVKALERVFASRSVFRARIGTDAEGRLTQSFDAEPIPVEVFHVGEEEFAERFSHIIRPFELDGGRLARCEIFITPKRNVFFLDIHHIIWDGATGENFRTELTAAYHGEEPSPEIYTLAEEAAAEAKRIGGDVYRKGEAYFDALVGGCETDCLPVRDVYSDTPGTSEAVFFEDISRAYLGETVEPERYTGFEAALEEQKLRAGKRYEEAKAYYAGLLSGVDAECLPPKTRPESDGGIAALDRVLSLDVGAVKAYCERNKMTVNARLNGLAAYDKRGCHMVETDNTFTTNILYRLGFSWPLINDDYLDKVIDSIATLGFFDPDGDGEG